MLIVPLTGRRFRENLPWFTIAIIAINCLVYFALQAGDAGNGRRAEAFYHRSGLADIEVPLYIAYLQERGRPSGSGDRLSEVEWRVVLHGRIEGDDRFLSRLESGAAFGGDRSRFDEWRRLRSEYELMRSRSVSYRFGLKPAKPTALTFITYMFLHGGFSHLLGNMIFLWIMGCLIEAGCGRAVFLLEYLLGGVLAAGLYCLVYPHSRVPLVGASGAIAALMGIFTVLYGRRRMRVFYSLGFYFGTVTIPAIVVLPCWVGNELLQLFFSGPAHVAYMAHVGGLLGGALMGAANRVLPMPGAAEVPEAAVEPQDPVAPLMEQALEKIAALELPAAEKLLEQALRMDPGRTDALRHLFHIRKLAPHAGEFRTTARELISRLLRDPGTQAEALDVYREYRRIPRRPPLPAGLYLQIALALIGRGRVDEAERLLAALVRQRPDFPGIATALFKLAAACRERGRKDRWRRYRDIICARFPDSEEARVLRRRQA